MAASSEGEGPIRQGKPIVPPFSGPGPRSLRPLFRASAQMTGRMTLPPFAAQRVVEAAPEARETLARAVTEPMLPVIDEPENDWFDAPASAAPEPTIEFATLPDQSSPDQSSEASEEPPEEPAAEWAVEAENRDLLYGLRSSEPTAINATVSLDGPEVEDRRPEWSGPTPRSVTPITLGSVYKPSMDSVLPFDSMPRFDSSPPAPTPPPAPGAPAAMRMPTPIAFRAIPDLGAPTRRIAEALETVAARVRRGELAVGGNVPEGDERAAIAAVLAALLGVAPA